MSRGNRREWVIAIPALHLTETIDVEGVGGTDQAIERVWDSGQLAERLPEISDDISVFDGYVHAWVFASDSDRAPVRYDLRLCWERHVS